MVDWQVHTYASLSSTQDYVRELAEEGLPEGTVVQCLTQTKGRGRQGNEWNSPIGNLYMSALLRPGCTANQAGQLAFVVALAVSAAMDDVIESGHKKTLKWPNDILVDGKKAAGILLESDIQGDRVEGLTVGVGVNIMAPPEGAAGLQALSGGGQVPIHPFRDKLLAHLGREYECWQGEGFAPVREAWLAQAHGLGQAVKVRLAAEEFSGVFKDLDADGTLLVELADGNVRAVRAGDVYFEESE
ncbi:MAG: biotin--[acetyl-CoA-carboxylase] ligase [Rhodospirillales bacterium]|nr:biotin--[acetyl-CoA-carboxylase] ligase [Rhodospirillales bacterium]